MLRNNSSRLTSLVRLASALAFVILIIASSGLLQAGADGRTHSVCITGCNATSKGCKAQCRIDCLQLFPNDADARGACQAECNSTCKESKDDCKLVCQANKFPSSPEEP